MELFLCEAYVNFETGTSNRDAGCTRRPRRPVCVLYLCHLAHRLAHFHLAHFRFQRTFRFQRICALSASFRGRAGRKTCFSCPENASAKKWRCSEGKIANFREKSRFSAEKSEKWPFFCGCGTIQRTAVSLAHSAFSAFFHLAHFFHLAPFSAKCAK